ncbi:hypothetical protein HOF67_03185 [Candidatus Peregrinibacteria bacterium]|jgi:hypothetical protein|nr:hypothetical protein [Candidatus Peregrinibacteria bacterium]
MVLPSPDGASLAKPQTHKTRIGPWGTPTPTTVGQIKTTEATIHVLTAIFIEEELATVHQKIVDLIRDETPLDEILKQLRQILGQRLSTFSPNTVLQDPDETSRAHRNEIRRLLFKLYGVDYVLRKDTPKTNPETLQ